MVVEGRVLLRVLEHGAGPAVEIVWPTTVSERQRLYKFFNDCLGMRLALMDERGNLYLANGTRGKPLAVNMDLYSGFVRRPAGHVMLGEQRAARRIARHHRVLSRTVPVRLFPRRVDAVLLGGLRHIVGETYNGAKTVHASYSMSQGHVYVGAIRIDGRTVSGRINLSRAARPGCMRRRA